MPKTHKALSPLLLSLLVMTPQAGFADQFVGTFAGSEAPWGHVHGGPGGGPFQVSCPVNAFATGVVVHAGAWIVAIGMTCAVFNPATKRLDPPVGGTPFQGGGGGQEKRAYCGSDHYLSKLKYGFTRDENRPKYLDYVELTCTPVQGGSDKTMCLDTGKEGCWDRHPSPGPYNGFGLAFESHCRPDEAADGLYGRSGAYVDALALHCSNKPEVPRPPGPPSLK